MVSLLLVFFLHSVDLHLLSWSLGILLVLHYNYSITHSVSSSAWHQLDKTNYRDYGFLLRRCLIAWISWLTLTAQPLLMWWRSLIGLLFIVVLKVLSLDSSPMTFVQTYSICSAEEMWDYHRGRYQQSSHAILCSITYLWTVFKVAPSSPIMHSLMQHHIPCPRPIRASAPSGSSLSIYKHSGI